MYRKVLCSFSRCLPRNSRMPDQTDRGFLQFVSDIIIPSRHKTRSVGLLAFIGSFVRGSSYQNIKLLGVHGFSLA